jgi:hypothetical protein
MYGINEALDGTTLNSPFRPHDTPGTLEKTALKPSSFPVSSLPMKGHLHCVTIHISSLTLTVICHKTEGREFETRWGDLFFNLPVTGIASPSYYLQ